MNLIDVLKAIELPATKNPIWYYHSFYFEKNRFEDMITDGIKCRKLLGLKASGNNGHHYISLVKDLGVNGQEYGFDDFMESSTSFIISGINPVRCSTIMFPFFHLLANTSISLRSSGWKDEFQEYLKICPDKYVGIQCPLYNWINTALDERYIIDITHDLKNLKSIIEILREYEIVLPIYDYSRRDGESVHLINQDKYLDKYDGVLEEVKSLTKSKMEKASPNTIKIVI